MKGSSMEARFALSSMRKYLVENKAYLVDCITGYSDRNDKWVMVDNTFGKMLTF
jgi:hypothetical protein